MDDSCSIQYLLVLFYILTMNQYLSEFAIAVLVNFDTQHVHNTDILLCCIVDLVNKQLIVGLIF